MIFNHMGPFSEGYSREGFETKQEEAERAKDFYKSRGSGFSQRQYDQFQADWLAAETRVKQMLAEGQKEATELNAELDRLQENLVDAMRALEAFKRDKLGMTEKTEDAEIAS